MVKIASFFWTIGNLCNLWHGVHNLQRIFKEHSYILELIEKSKASPEKIIFAQRKKRTESFTFRLFYRRCQVNSNVSFMPHGDTILYFSRLMILMTTSWQRRYENSSMYVVDRFFEHVTVRG